MQGNGSYPPIATLLYLPDEVLLSIWEGVFHSRLQDSLRIAEILVNRRIFAIARPIWFSRLRLNGYSLEHGLSALLQNGVRCQALRDLTLPIISDLARLTETVVARIPRLTHLTLVSFRRPEDDQLVADTLVAIVASPPQLQNLDLEFHDYTQTQIDLMEERCMQARGPRCRSIRVFRDSRALHSRAYSDGGLLTHVRFIGVSAKKYRQLDWNTLESFVSIRGPARIASPVRDMLLGLAAALKKDDKDQTTFLPLRRLVLDFDYGMNWRDKVDGRRDGFDMLFDLLPATRLERLELTSVYNIPLVKGPRAISSTGHLDAFSRFLLSFPALVQLHLIGDNFFDKLGTSANNFSKLETAKLSVRYPELHVLLFLLVRTEVKIFTYRGQDESRELRWTRTDEKEDFDRECWTL
ncbi:hypothetical protein JCM16303_004697 [Sporobolomyces ruberrimus]